MPQFRFPGEDTLALFPASYFSNEQLELERNSYYQDPQGAGNCLLPLLGTQRTHVRVFNGKFLHLCLLFSIERQGVRGGKQTETGREEEVSVPSGVSGETKKKKKKTVGN